MVKCTHRSIFCSHSYTLILKYFSKSAEFTKLYLQIRFCWIPGNRLSWPECFCFKISLCKWRFPLSYWTCIILQILLQFATFVCSSTKCNANINVYDGVSKNSSLLATISAGQPLPVLISSGALMLLEYITDPSAPSSFNGSYSSGIYPALVCIIW